MWRAVPAVVLFAVGAHAQTIYRFTDAHGTVHFTDDASSIPSGVKAVTTEGEELSNTGTPMKISAPAAQSAQPEPVAVSGQALPSKEEEYWREQFRAAREKVRSLEDELAVDTRRFEDPSRTPLGPSVVCPYGYGYGAGFAPGVSVVQRGNLGASASLPLGNGAQVSVSGSTTRSVRQSTVAPFGSAGYGYAGYGYGCWVGGEYTRVRERLERNRASLARAREELADLERRAAFNAVPLEWRR
ncbi:MAG: DUF4124 domain-containing protein [Archangiaceae bacterium]|nr:DUF4124 domain-containing protein [Archangiaceae bacterium]